MVATLGKIPRDLGDFSHRRATEDLVSQRNKQTAHKSQDEE